MDHSQRERLSEAEKTEAALEGATIYGMDDKKIGTVSHMHGEGANAHVVLDVGGFLGIGSKWVAVPLTDLDFMRDPGGAVHATTGWTEDDLKNLPEHHH